MGFPFGQYVHLDVPTEDANIADIDVYNIIAPVDRIGIQGPPGMPFILNGQPMYIGRTGLFEIETDINSLVISGQYQFIVDYHTKQS